MSETTSLETIERRLDGLQNNVSGVNRRLITLESSLTDRMGALEARMAELGGRRQTVRAHQCAGDRRELSDPSG
jgi:hypothetical protein